MLSFMRGMLITFVFAALTGCGKPEPKVVVSSQLGEYGPQGLFSAAAPGWHAETPPKFPESLTVDFQERREIKLLGLLQQNGQPARAPKSARIDMSEDGNTWIPVVSSENACSPNTPDGWFNIALPAPKTSRFLKLTIFSNCGDAQFLTLQGLRVE